VKPAFIQGLFAFDGKGLETPCPFASPVAYNAPPDRRAQTIYFRAGNAAPEMIYPVLLRRGAPMRCFPMGAKAAQVAAPRGLQSSVLAGIGFLEIA
jgi:hypothetical protein